MKRPPTTWTSVLLCAATALAITVPALGDPVPPDSAGADPAHPFSRHRIKKLPVGTPVTFYPTSAGQRIRNADGQEVRSSGRASPDVSAAIPGILNGRNVNDIEIVVGKPGDPLDPGIMRAAAFVGGFMTPSIGAWLRDNGYTAGAEIQLPQFLRVDFPIVYYGVNLAAVGPAGAAFATTTPTSTILPTGPGGTLPGLPGYIFSSTPMFYAPGTGWIGTPLPPGTLVEFVGVDYFSEGAPCVADINGDGLVDFSDYLDFLNLYDALDPAADFNGDGLIDFGDYLEFLNHYDAEC